MPRFVVQQHFRSAEDFHFDLMLEREDLLVTFACGGPPDRTAELPRLAKQLQDHRLAYLDYEGEISGGRGWCELHDRGTFEWLEPEGGANLDYASQIRVRLDGRKARGVWELEREPASGIDYWRLKAVPD